MKSKQEKRIKILPKADICLILEGTYPYVKGGVSGWVHNLIKTQKDLTFNAISILPKNFKPEIKYELPDNLLGISNLYLNELPQGTAFSNRRDKTKLIKFLSVTLSEIIISYDMKSFEKLVHYLSSNKKYMGKKNLIDSVISWEIILKMYKQMMDNSSFLDFFWSWRTLFGGMFSVLLGNIPEASCYHSLCTGYAGLMLARASLEKGKPCALTEHGIYTNERRIELSTADWLYDNENVSLSIDKLEKKTITGFHELWTRFFSTYSHLCYEASDRIITLYEGNRTLQISEGAKKNRTSVIRNGIDLTKYATIEKLKSTKKSSTPTVAFIGRIVPVKDVRTFLNSIAAAKGTIPSIKAYILGPKDEDPEYYSECLNIINDNNLSDTVHIEGEVNILSYLPEIDVLVLTSLSEAQPLVILEAGAAGIPVVATDVGACREMIEGTPDENPQIGHGGIITPLSNSRSTANAIINLLSNNSFYKQCSLNLKKRVEKYYNLETQNSSYNKLYNELIRKDYK